MTADGRHRRQKLNKSALLWTSPRVYFESLLALESGREPVKSFIQSVTTGGAGALDVPLPVADAVEAKLVRNLGDGHSVRKILLVGEDKNDGIAELILVKHLLEFLGGFLDTLPIVGIDDEDKALGVLEVVPPEGANLILTTDIPNGEVDLLVLNSLDLENQNDRRLR